MPSLPGVFLSLFLLALLFASLGYAVHLRAQARLQRQALEAAENFTAHLIDALPSLLIVVSDEGHISHWNRAAEHETGLTLDAVRGRALSDICTWLPIEAGKLRSVIKAGIPYLSENLLYKDGDTSRYCDLGIYPFRDIDGKSAVIRIDDVTPRVRMENMMIQNEKMLSLGELAAGMAHEINNPLSAILHGVQNIHRRTAPGFDANQREAERLNLNLMDVHTYLERRNIFRMLDDMRDAGERSARIVTNMLEFSRSSGRKQTQVRLQQVIEHSLDLSQKLATLSAPDERGQPAFKIDVDAGLAPVRGSAVELQQVVLNLLSNALQAFEQSTETVAQPEIRVALKREGNRALLSVADNGPGMEDEVRRHIFEPFYTTKDVGKGTGLGLSVSYFIITEHHGGTIEVESAPGMGSCFNIRLPLMGA
ncbi:two-component system sensor histidine kinase NtrB [Marinimicrobium alkaliphilum]|uniref:two-component system sensor histidine kinase NtrB n=1 Tax=Marinimicrobium alkaliphilum TaxID=2202654 RepID=UPI0018E07606|nr:ATP-binding protein [Marinimicrobium alkaliphilum]